MQVQSVACIQNQQLLHQGNQQELANVVKWLHHTWEPYPESFWLTLFFVFFWRNWFIFQSMLNMSGREWLWVSELSRKLVMVSLPFFTSWNLKAVNLYLHSFFLRSEFDCSLVADSMLLLEFSSTSRVWKIAFLASFRLSEITNVSNWGIEAMLLQCKRWEISNNRPLRTGWNLTEARPGKWY